MQNQIPEGWQRVKLGEVTDINSRQIEKNYPHKDIEYVDISSVGTATLESTTKYSISDAPGRARRLVSYGDTIISTVRPNRRSFYYFKDPKDNLVVSTGFAVLSSKPKITDSRFVYYLVTSKSFTDYLVSNVKGSAYPAIGADVFENAEVLIPKYEDQKQIASVLSTFDDKIEVNNKIAKTLEEMAQATFKEWFVKYRFPGYKKVEFIDSELGKIPKGWTVGKFKQLVAVISGYPFSSKLYNASEGIGIVTIKNVQDGKFVTECDSFIKEDRLPHNFNSACNLTNGDVILSLTGNVGRVCFVYGDKYLLNQRVAKLVPKRPNDLAYCYFMFRQIAMQNYMINMAKGSAQPNLSPVELSNTKFAIPSYEILDLFSKVAGPIYTQLLGVTNQNLSLAKTRDLLLPKLMKGEIRV